MVQVIRSSQPGSLIGEQLQQGLSTGLQSGFQQLLSQKLRGLQQQQTARGLEATGISPSMAQNLALLDPSILNQVIKSHLEQPKRTRQQQFLEEQGLPGGITEFAPAAQKAFIQSLLPEAQEATLQRLLSNQLPQEKEQASENLQQRAGINIPEDSVRDVELQPSTQQEALDYKNSQKKFTTEPGESFKETKKEINDYVKAKPLGYELAPGAKAERATNAIQEKLAQADLTPRERILLEKRQEDIKRKFGPEQEKLDKKYDPYVEELRKKSKGFESVNNEVDKLLSLVNTGKLTGTVKGSIFEAIKSGIHGVGLDLFGLTSTETQEFKKVQANLLRNIKDWFGGRITDQEVRRFMDTLPSLNQTDEGKRRVIRDIKLLNQAEITRAQTMEEIIKENGGHVPRNLPSLVEGRAKKQLDSLAEQFKIEYVSPQKLAKEQRARKVPFLGPLAETLEDVVTGTIY